MKPTVTLYLTTGQRIARLRQAAGLSQERLAHKAGLDRSYVGKIEQGAKRASLETLDKIAAALGVALFELFVTAPLDKTDRSPV